MIINWLKVERTLAMMTLGVPAIRQVNLWDCSVKKRISQSCAALISAYDSVTGVALSY